MFNIDLNRAKRESVNEIFFCKSSLIMTSSFIMIFIFLNLINAYDILIMIVKKKKFFFF